MGGLYDILESYRQQNDPKFVYEGLYEEPAYTGPNIDPMYNLGARQFGNMDRMDFGVPQQKTGIMQQAPLDMNRFQGVSDMSIIDETTNDEQSQEYIDQVKKSQSSGIGGLLKFLLGLAVPGAGLLMNLGQGGFDKLRGGFNKGLGSLRNLNQRIQGSNFGKATSLADYFDMRKYGGYQGRENARARTMAQARGVQKQIDQRPSAKPTAQDIARGGGRSSPSPSRTSPQSGMQAARTRSRDLGSMRGGVGR